MGIQNHSTTLSETDVPRMLPRYILKGNTLSFAKAFGITVQNQLKVEIDLKEIKVNFKNEGMTAFYRSFKINFSFPDYFGIGSVSRGFGNL